MMGTYGVICKRVKADAKFLELSKLGVGESLASQEHHGRDCEPLAISTSKCRLIFRMPLLG